MDDLPTFLRARLDEDERAAQAAADYRDGATHDVQGPQGTWVLLPDAEFFGAAQLGGTIGPRIGHTNHVALGAHIARHDPARTLREVEAKRALLGDLTAERHDVVEDCWYTCAAATEEDDGGESCDDTKRGGPCNCGRDARVNRSLRLLAQPFADHADYREEWRPQASG